MAYHGVFYSSLCLILQTFIMESNKIAIILFKCQQDTVENSSSVDINFLPMQNSSSLCFLKTTWSLPLPQRKTINSSFHLVQYPFSDRLRLRMNSWEILISSITKRMGPKFYRENICLFQPFLNNHNKVNTDFYGVQKDKKGRFVTYNSLKMHQK
jgi:hypothetical protein